MAKSFTTFIEKRSDALWITLPDSIDMDNYSKIESSIQSELSSESKAVVMDFCRTKSLFSAGLGLVVRLKKKIEEDLGLKFYLVNVNKKLEEGFENVGLDRVLQIFSIEEVEAQLSKN